MVIMPDAAVGRAHSVRFPPSQEGGLVALWMTNRERHWRFVERELLPGWGLQPAATWLWLKTANNGRPVAPLVRNAISRCQTCPPMADAPLLADFGWQPAHCGRQQRSCT